MPQRPTGFGRRCLGNAEPHHHPPQRGERLLDRDAGAGDQLAPSGKIAVAGAYIDPRLALHGMIGGDGAGHAGYQGGASVFASGKADEIADPRTGAGHHAIGGCAGTGLGRGASRSRMRAMRASAKRA